MSDFKFGDIVNNGWASERNPQKISMILRATSRKITCTDKEGNIIKFRNDDQVKLIRVGSIFDDATELQSDDLRRAKTEANVRKPGAASLEEK